MLHYRGAIMRILSANIPVQEWDLQEVIAMFCSGIDRNHSFSRHYEATHNRLPFALFHRIITRMKNPKADDTDKYTAICIGYTLACMEYDGGEFLDGHFDKSKPTQHIRRFAELYMRNPEHFLTFKNNQNSYLRKDTAEYLNGCSYTEEWAKLILDDAVKANLDYMFPGGLAAVEKLAEKPRRKRYRKSKKTQDKPMVEPAVKVNDVSNTTVFNNPRVGLGFSIPYHLPYDPSRIEPYAKNDDFFRALMEPMPQVTAETKLTLKDPLSDFTAIKANLGLREGKLDDVNILEQWEAVKRFHRDLTVPGMIELRDKQKREDAELDAEVDLWEAELEEANRRAAELEELDRRAAGLRVVEDEEMEDGEMEDEDGYGSDGSEDMDMSE